MPHASARTTLANFIIEKPSLGLGKESVPHSEQRHCHRSPPLLATHATPGLGTLGAYSSAPRAPGQRSSGDAVVHTQSYSIVSIQ